AFLAKLTEEKPRRKLVGDDDAGCLRRPSIFNPNRVSKRLAEQDAAYLWDQWIRPFERVTGLGDVQRPLPNDNAGRLWSRSSIGFIAPGSSGVANHVGRVECLDL